MENRVGVSEEEREMLRESVRRLLEAKWPMEEAVERSTDAKAVLDIWSDCARQGLTSLGADLQEAGLSEIMLVFDELGRASCPAPLIGAVSANLLFSGSGRKTDLVSEILGGVRQGTAAPAIVLAEFDGDCVSDSDKGTVSLSQGVASLAWMS